MGPTTPKKATGGSAGSGAGALGTRRRGSRQRERCAAAFRPGAVESIGRRMGSTISWCQSSPSRLAVFALTRQTDLATHVVFHVLFSTAQARLRRYVCRGLRWFFQLRRRGRALQHLERVAGGIGASSHRRGVAAAANVGRNGLGGTVVPLCMRRAVRGALRLGRSRVLRRCRPPATSGAKARRGGGLGPWRGFPQLSGCE